LSAKLLDSFGYSTVERSLDSSLEADENNNVAKREQGHQGLLVVGGHTTNISEKLGPLLHSVNDYWWNY